MNTIEDTLRNEQEELSSPYDLFKNEHGAIDLASIMVGIIVIGLIGGVIAATVFAVIPWAQDAAAKHQLESIHTAENAYFGFSSSALTSLPAGSKQNSFASSAELETAGLLSRNKNYCAAVPADSKIYNAYSLSATGKIWTSNDKNSQPTIFFGTLPSACPELLTETTRVGATTPDGTTTGNGTTTTTNPDGSTTTTGTTKNPDGSITKTTSTTTPTGTTTTTTSTTGTTTHPDGTTTTTTTTDTNGTTTRTTSKTNPDGTPADISSPGMGDGTSPSTSGTLTGDGSGSYFPKSTSWLSAYGPVMSNTLPSPILDMGGWSSPSSITASSTSVTAYFKTNGTFTGIGGSWIYLIHADISCYVPSTNSYYNRTALLANSLHGPYSINRPGPHSSGIGVGCGPFAPQGAVLSQVLLRQATDAEWGNYSLGYLGYCYTIPGLSEGWINPYVPQQ